MEYLAMMVLSSSVAWFLGMLISTFARTSGGILPIMALVYVHPSRLVLIAVIISFVLAILIYLNSRQYLLTLCTIPPMFLGVLLMLYQCLDMNAWYLAHFPFTSLKHGEPFQVIGFTLTFLLKAAAISGVALFPALNSLGYGYHGRKRARNSSGFPIDVPLMSVCALVLLGLLALLSTKTGFGMHFFSRGYLKYLF